MAWIELHDTLPQNKKIVRIKRHLKIKTAQAVGHVCLLWLWAVNNAEDGNLRDLDNEDIAEIADWQKGADTFVQALCEVGFLDKLEDGTLAIHDWSSYAGRLLEQRQITREQQKARQQKRRQKLRDAALSGAFDNASCHAHVTRDNDVTVVQEEDTVTRESRVNHAHTIPYHTIPNQTKPNLKRSTSLSDEREVPRESPPDPVQNENRTLAITDPNTIAINDYEGWLMQNFGWSAQDIRTERMRQGVERITHVSREREAIAHG